MELHCLKCDPYFKVCTLCRNSKYQLLNDADIKIHQRLNSHKKNVSKFKNKLEEKKVEEENFEFNLNYTSSKKIDPEQQVLSQHLSTPKM